MSLQVHHHIGDLSPDIVFENSVAVDTETMGLLPYRDRLCLVQLSGGDGHCHIIQFKQNDLYQAPYLKKILNDQALTKIFHFARFDVAVLYHYLQIITQPLFCTKIASKLVRTFTECHGLKDLCKELLNIDISKEQQSSDWGTPNLSPEQLKYAATDVLYLHQLKEIFDERLNREKRQKLAQACFDFIPTCSQLDLMGYKDLDIFNH